MSLSKAKIKYIQSLKDKKRRNEHQTFVVEGNKMISELLPLLKCQILAATSDFLNTADLRYVEESIEASTEELSRVSFVKTPQQALAVFYQPNWSFDSSSLTNNLVLALDGIQDPGNLGTIIRLADWYGIRHILCSQDTVDVFNPKTVQATMGAIARVQIHYVDLLAYLKTQRDIPVYGTFLDGQNMYEQELSANGIIVMGNEGNGISSEIEKLISNKLFIPNYPPNEPTSESLNVAVATAVICAEFRRRSF